MTSAARPARRPAGRRGLQLVTAATALALAGGLVAGALADDDPASGTAATPGTPSAHHGAGAAPGTTGTPSVPATTAPTAAAHPGHATTAPGTAVGADGRVVHDHGDLEVTVMLGEDGGTRVHGPVRPGAWFSVVNHTTADQVLTTADGALAVDVPLVRLVTVRAPAAPGTYRLVSTTDAGVTAEVVVAG